MKMKFYTIFALHIFIIMVSFMILAFILESIVDIYPDMRIIHLIANIVAIALIGLGAGMLYNLIYTWNNAPRILLLPRSGDSLHIQKIVHGALLGIGMVLLVWASERILGKDIEIGIVRRPFALSLYMILPSFFEEILFRGGLTHIFYAIGKSKIGIIVSGVLFGATHIINIVQQQSFSFTDGMWIVNLIIMGIVLGYFYIRFGLVVVIGVHWFWNAFFGDNMQIVETSFSTTLIPMGLIIFYEMVVHKKRV